MTDKHNFNKFALAGTVQRISILEKVHFVSLVVEREGRKDYLDVTGFPRECSFADLAEGDIIELAGHIAKKKDNKTGTWSIGLVANQCKVLQKAESRAAGSEHGDDNLRF